MSLSAKGIVANRYRCSFSPHSAWACFIFFFLPASRNGQRAFGVCFRIKVGSMDQEKMEIRVMVYVFRNIFYVKSTVATLKSLGDDRATGKHERMVTIFACSFYR